MAPSIEDANPPPARSPFRRIVHTLLWILAAAWLVFTGWRLFGGETAWPLTMAIGYTPYVIVATAILLLVAAALRTGRLFAVVMLCGCSLAAVVIPRMFDDSVDVSGAQVNIATVDLQGGDPADVRKLAQDQQLNVLVVQGLTAATAKTLQRQLHDRLPHQVVTPNGPEGTIGIYSQRPMTKVGNNATATHGMVSNANVDIGEGISLDLSALALPPPDNKQHFKAWREAMRQLPSPKESAPHRVLIGDFSATLDHAAMRDLLNRGYKDAADETGTGLHGTWRSGAFGLPTAVDHVLVDAGLHATSAVVAELPNQDHRALTTTITVPTSSD